MNGHPQTLGTPGTPGPDIEELLDLFPHSDDLAGHQQVPGEDVPEPYHSLLVHEHHMTVTVEAHHGEQVNVRVLAERRDGDTYSRKILLALASSGRIVQYGIVRIHFQYCSDTVRRAILAKDTPLGRVLIQHNVLRRIEPTAFLRIFPGSTLLEWFDLDEMKVTYGRTAYIHCDGKPAIELLEIVAPE